MSHRLRPIVEVHLQPTEFCGVPANTKLDAVATVREAIAYAETKKEANGRAVTRLKNRNARISHITLLNPPVLRTRRPFHRPTQADV